MGSRDQLCPRSSGSALPRGWPGPCRSGVVGAAQPSSAGQSVADSSPKLVHRGLSLENGQGMLWLLLPPCSSSAAPPGLASVLRLPALAQASGLPSTWLPEGASHIPSTLLSSTEAWPAFQPDPLASFPSLNCHLLWLPWASAHVLPSALPAFSSCFSSPSPPQCPVLSSGGCFLTSSF